MAPDMPDTDSDRADPDLVIKYKTPGFTAIAVQVLEDAVNGARGKWLRGERA
jgi:hypothetical protein